MSVRIESDAIGNVSLDDACYYGLQTQRALQNFAVSGRSIAEMPELVKALAMVKKAAALTNKATAAIPEAGQLQLNAMEPLVVWTLSETIETLINAVRSLRLNCVDGLEIDAVQCAFHLERSTALAASLVPHTGYDVAARYTCRAMVEGIPFRDFIARERPDLVAYLEAGSE